MPITDPNLNTHSVHDRYPEQDAEAPDDRAEGERRRPGLLTEMEIAREQKTVNITLHIPWEAIGADTDRLLRSWFRKHARDPFKLLELARQVLEDEEKYRSLPQWDLNHVCEGCGRPLRMEDD